MSQRSLILTDEMKRCERVIRQVLKIKPNEGDCSGLYDELKEIAWNVLHDEPGCECGDWINELIWNYSTEVAETLCCDPDEAYEQLSDWWDCMDYEDVRTGMCERYRDWAEYFCNEKSVELYDWVVTLIAKQESRGELSPTSTTTDVSAALLSERVRALEALLHEKEARLNEKDARIAEKLEALEALLAEKERTIQILLGK